MARPIRETPILEGEDASRFTSEMERIENLPKEEKAEKLLQFQKDAHSALSTIKICL